MTQRTIVDENGFVVSVTFEKTAEQESEEK